MTSKRDRNTPANKMTYKCHECGARAFIYKERIVVPHDIACQFAAKVKQMTRRVVK